MYESGFVVTCMGYGPGRSWAVRHHVLVCKGVVQSLLFCVFKFCVFVCALCLGNRVVNDSVFCTVCCLEIESSSLCFVRFGSLSRLFWSSWVD